jgi:hypothetical protein
VTDQEEDEPGGPGGRESRGPGGTTESDRVRVLPGGIGPALSYDSAWCLEAGDGSTAEAMECQLCLADGLIGSRAVLEEDRDPDVPPVLVADVYEPADGAGERLMTASTWVALPIVQGLPAGRRVLDLRDGPLTREARSDGKTFRSVRGDGAPDGRRIACAGSNRPGGRLRGLAPPVSERLGDGTPAGGIAAGGDHRPPRPAAGLLGATVDGRRCRGDRRRRRYPDPSGLPVPPHRIDPEARRPSGREGSPAPPTAATCSGRRRRSCFRPLSPLTGLPPGPRWSTGSDDSSRPADARSSKVVQGHGSRGNRPTAVRRCVLTRTADVHAAAWKATFDPFLNAESLTPPFDPVGDYLAYVDGRPRTDGV